MHALRSITFAFLVRRGRTPLMASSWAPLRPSWRPSEDRATELVSALVVGSKGELRGRDWAGRVMVNRAVATLPTHDAGCDGTGLGSGREADSEVARAVTLDVEGARQYDWGMGMGAGATLEVKEAGGDCTGSGRGAETSCATQGAALEVKGAGGDAAGRSGGLDARQKSAEDEGGLKTSNKTKEHENSHCSSSSTPPCTEALPELSSSPLSFKLSSSVTSSSESSPPSSSALRLRRSSRSLSISLLDSIEVAACRLKKAVSNCSAGRS